MLEDILETRDDSENENLFDVYINYPDEIKHKTNNFPFCPLNRTSPQDKFSKHMNDIKPNSYTRKLIFDWTDKNKSLILYRMLKIYVEHGVVVDKVQEIISLKQSNWLEKHIMFFTQKTNQAVNDFEKDFVYIT